MTLAPAFFPRAHLADFALQGEKRLFQVAPDTQVLAHCHWQKSQPRSHPTMVILHGLEGSSESKYVLGVAYKALASGFNAVRVNLRNCGDTMHLTPTLYNAGLSPDVVSILHELRNEGYNRIFLVGYSLGGNIVLKTAGELGSDGPALLTGVAAISPSLDLETCVKAIEHPDNRFYDQWFLRSLKGKVRAKAKLFPELYDTSLLRTARTLRQFDDIYTAPAGGYENAAVYYSKASAIRVVQHIAVPTLIIVSEDDPLIPFSSFSHPNLQNRFIRLNATKFGGHAGFIQHAPEDKSLLDLFWAENRVVGFCQEVMTTNINASMI